jgi:GTPase SAR1 family protein
MYYEESEYGIIEMSGIRHRSGSHGGSDKDVHYRVVVLGAPGVGKSSIISQFLMRKDILS